MRKICITAVEQRMPKLQNFTAAVHYFAKVSDTKLDLRKINDTKSKNIDGQPNMLGRRSRCARM
jgi:hypothetical protein